MTQALAFLNLRGYWVVRLCTLNKMAKPESAEPYKPDGHPLSLDLAERHVGA